MASQHLPQLPGRILPAPLVDGRDDFQPVALGTVEASSVESRQRQQVAVARDQIRIGALRCVGNRMFYGTGR